MGLQRGEGDGEETDTNTIQIQIQIQYINNSFLDLSFFSKKIQRLFYTFLYTTIESLFQNSNNNNNKIRIQRL